MLPSIKQIFRSYEAPEIILELAVIWICVYLVFRFLKGTRGAGIIKGFAVLLVLVTLTIKLLGQGTDALGRLNFIYDRFLGLAALLLIVVFQPELRQAMIRLGHAGFFRRSNRQVNQVVDAVSEAAQFLSKSQFGALIAIERSVGLRSLIEGGERLDAQVSARLLESIFWPNSPLHDLGVVIRGDRIVAANVQFPLAEEGSLPREHGSRHRAAVGITLDSDCLVVVVSEETRSISLVERGVVDADIPRDRIRETLLQRLGTPPGRGPAEQPDAAPDAPAEESPPGAGLAAKGPEKRSTAVPKEA